MERVLNQRVKGLPVSLYVIAFLLATIAWFASGDTTQCALAASCQTTDTEDFGAGAEFNQNRGGAAENDFIVHGDTVDEILDCDASADTCFFNGTVDGTGATVLGFGTFVTAKIISTTSTYNVPVGVTRALVVACGGGGGGGGGDAVNGGGSGGGGAGCALSTVDLSGVPSVSVTIGAGGAGGGAGLDGSAGGTTSFGAFAVATGGAGGEGADGVNNNGGAGGGASTADIGWAGSRGGGAEAAAIPGGAGGDSFLGQGGPVSVNTTAFPGTSCGPGGGGAYKAAVAGAAGQPGCVLIYEFN